MQTQLNLSSLKYDSGLDKEGIVVRTREYSRIGNDKLSFKEIKYHESHLCHIVDMKSDKYNLHISGNLNEYVL